MSSGLLRLSSPENFNDPYDTNIVLNTSDLKSIRDAIVNYFLDLKVREMIENCYQNKKFGSKIIFLSQN